MRLRVVENTRPRFFSLLLSCTDDVLITSVGVTVFV